MATLYKTIKNKAFWIVAPLLLLIGVAISSAAPMAKKERVRMKMYYFKLENGDRKIDIALTAGSGKNMHGVKEATVLLSAVFEDTTMLLAELKTDTLGVIELFLAEDYKLPEDEEGLCQLQATYDGDGTYQSASQDITISDLHLDISFEVVDSVKELHILAYTIDTAKEQIPVADLDIQLGVQRLFSVLPLEKVTTDDDGMATYEFPVDLPGDDGGNITVVAKVDDSDIFGTVSSKATEQWGVPVSYELHPLPRQLYTDEAPLWMIASVFIILLGAWYHFFLSISKLIKLKKAGKSA